MPSVKLKPGVKDVRGKDLKEFVGIEFDCYLYKDYVVVRNHLNKRTHEVEYKYVTIIAWSLIGLGFFMLCEYLFGKTTTLVYNNY